jgi:hypothetical protein
MAVYKLTVCLAHTTSTYVPCSLYTHLEYNNMAHDTSLAAESYQSHLETHHDVF